MVYCVSRYIDSELDRLDKDHFKRVFEYIAGLDTLAPELSEVAENLINSVLPKPSGFYTRGNSPLWRDLQNIFQQIVSYILNFLLKILLYLERIKSNLLINYL